MWEQGPTGLEWKARWVRVSCFNDLLCWGAFAKRAAAKQNRAGGMPCGSGEWNELHMGLQVGGLSLKMWGWILSSRQMARYDCGMCVCS